MHPMHQFADRESGDNRPEPLPDLEALADRAESRPER